MSSNDDERPSAPAAPRRGRVWITVLVCALIFGFGGVVGAGITAIRAGRQARAALEHPDLLPVRVAHRLRGRLDLDDAQERQVEEIVRRHYPAIQQARERLLADLDPELDAIGSEIAALLAPDRARRFQERFEIFRDELLPRRLAPRRGGR